MSKKMIPMTSGAGQRIWIAVGGLLVLLTIGWWLCRPTGEEPGAPGEARAQPKIDQDAPVLDAGGGTAVSDQAPKLVNALTPPTPASFVEDQEAEFGLMEGQVRSWSTGSGVGGAELTFMHDGVAISITADAAGEFRFRPNEAGRYELAVVSAEGFLPYAPAWGQSPISFVARARERISGVVLFLVPAVGYTGLVVDPEGDPVSGALVTVLDSPNPEQVLVSGPKDFVTDERGEFQFRAPDWSLLEARHAEFSPGRARVDLSTQVSHQLVIQLQPPTLQGEASLTIMGTVVLPDGSPAADTLVRTLIDSRATRRTTHTLSDVAGHFVLTGLDSGPYTLMASRQGNSPAYAHQVVGGTNGVVLQLGTGIGIRGCVETVADATPVPAFSVWVGESVGPLRVVSRASEAFYDSEGCYAMTGLGPGTYHVLVSAQGFAPERQTGVVIESEQLRPTEVNFQLNNGGRLTGRVVEQGTQMPLAGARVTVEGRSATAPSTILHLASATTDSEGRFELTSLAAGIHSITVAAVGHHAKIRSNISIQVGADAGPLTIELSPLAEGESPQLELAGIGAVLEPAGELLRIVRVIEGGGAAEVGLSPGDGIQAVEGQPVVGLGFDGAVQRIRGPAGTMVTLTIQRAGTRELVVMTVPRRKIRA